MTHQFHPNVSSEIVELLNEHGFDGMAQIMQRLVNECMLIERQNTLGVGPYERSEARNCQANGFKPNRMKTRVGELELSVPQVRGAKIFRPLWRKARSANAP